MKNKSLDKIIEEIGGLISDLKERTTNEDNYDDLMNIGKDFYNQGYGAIVCEILKKYDLIRKSK